MLVDPILDIDHPHRFHRLPNQFGAQIADENGNRQNQFADFFERPLAVKLLSLPNTDSMMSEDASQGGTGWKLGCLVLDLLQYPRF